MRLTINWKWGTLLVAGGLILALLFMTGVLDWQTATTKFRIQFSKITSQIEAPDMPPSRRLSGDEKRMAAVCRENLREIEAAKREVAQQAGIGVGTVPRADVIHKLGGQPECPMGGTYQFNTLEMLPTCSISANETIETGDDHLIKVY